jgi:hypothetical protein
MATNTYVALDKKTIETAVSSVTFTSIPQTYTDLILVVSGTWASAGYEAFGFQFNGDAGSNYSRTLLNGNGTSALSSREATSYWGALGDTQSNSIINIMNYSNSTTYKTVISRGSSAGYQVRGTVGLWRNTAAITSMVLTMASGNFAVGCTLSLYGIAAVGASPAPKATGGTIYSDSTYYYHAFGASGTFTPTSALTADVLVVGTGGVGAVYAGGGGAGGSIGYSSSVSLASGTAYTATIGASGTIPKVNSSASKVQSATSSTNCSFSGGAISTVTGTAGGNGSDTGAGGSNLSYSGGSGTGGGGAGFGANGTAGPGGAGGAGVSTYSSWGAATGLGQNVSGTYYFAGGGGGGTSSGASSGAGGNGGGGNGGADGYSGTANTGGGGGGAKNSPNYGDGGAGGTGVVIVRYAKA